MIHSTGERKPNDPKLSDSGVRRGTCMVGGKAVAEAGAVTHGAVRCSAWLGVAVASGQTLMRRVLALGVGVESRGRCLAERPRVEGARCTEWVS